jgi:hypothetical protein
MTADRDYLGRANGEGDSPEQQQAIQENRDTAQQLGQSPEKEDRPDQQPVPQDQNDDDS